MNLKLQSIYSFALHKLFLGRNELLLQFGFEYVTQQGLIKPQAFLDLIIQECRVYEGEVFWESLEALSMQYIENNYSVITIYDQLQWMSEIEMFGV